MKIFNPPTYTPVVRVEIKATVSKEMSYVTFCQTTIDEVFNHIHQKMKVGIQGTKVTVMVRVSDKEKRWGKLKSRTVYIESISKAIEQITEGIPNNRASQ